MTIITRNAPPGRRGGGAHSLSLSQGWHCHKYAKRQHANSFVSLSGLPPLPVNTSKAIDISSIVPSLRSNKTTEEETTRSSGFNIRRCWWVLVVLQSPAPLLRLSELISGPLHRLVHRLVSPGEPLSVCRGRALARLDSLAPWEKSHTPVAVWKALVSLSLSSFFLTPSLSSICQRDALLCRDSPRGDKLHNTAQPRTSVTTTGWTGRPTWLTCWGARPSRPVLQVSHVAISASVLLNLSAIIVSAPFLPFLSLRAVTSRHVWQVSGCLHPPQPAADTDLRAWRLIVGVVTDRFF